MVNPPLTFTGLVNRTLTNSIARRPTPTVRPIPMSYLRPINLKSGYPRYKRKAGKKKKRVARKGKKTKRVKGRVYARKGRVYRRKGVSYKRKGIFPLLALIPGLIAAGKAAAVAAGLGAAGGLGKAAVDAVLRKKGRKGMIRLTKKQQDHLWAKRKHGVLQDVMAQIGPQILAGLKSALADGSKSLGTAAIVGTGRKLFNKIFSKRKSGQLIRVLKKSVMRKRKGDLDGDFLGEFGGMLDVDDGDFSKTFVTSLKKPFLERAKQWVGKLTTKKQRDAAGKKILQGARNLGANVINRIRNRKTKTTAAAKPVPVDVAPAATSNIAIPVTRPSISVPLTKPTLNNLSERFRAVGLY